MANRKVPIERKRKAVAMLDAGEGIDLVAETFGIRRRTLEGWRRDVNGPRRPDAIVKKKVLKVLEKDPHKETTEVIALTGASPRYIQELRLEVLKKDPRPKSSSLLPRFYAEREPGKVYANHSFKAFTSSVVPRMFEHCVVQLDNKPYTGIDDALLTLEELNIWRNRFPEQQEELSSSISLACGLVSSGYYKVEKFQDSDTYLAQAWTEAREDPKSHAECMKHEGWLAFHLPNYEESFDWFSKSLECYEGFYPQVGYSIHRNGISSALYGRSAALYGLEQHEEGISDSNDAITALDPDVSPLLVVPVCHTHALHLTKLGQNEEAHKVVSDLLTQMTPDGNVPYAKVLWLDGLLAKSLPRLDSSRKILLRHNLTREVSVITTDMCLLERSPGSLYELMTLGSLGPYGSFQPLLKRFSPAVLRQIRADLKGDEIMPSLV